MKTIPRSRLVLSVPAILLGLLAIYVASLGFNDASQPKAASAVAPKDVEAEPVSVAEDGCWPFPSNQAASGDSSEPSGKACNQQAPTLAPAQSDSPSATGQQRFAILPTGRTVYIEVVAEQASLEVGMQDE